MPRGEPPAFGVDDFGASWAADIRPLAAANGYAADHHESPLVPVDPATLADSATTPAEGNLSETDDLRVITIKAGERHLAADAGLEALHAIGTPFYQRDRSLVHVAEIKARSTNGEVILVPGIATVTPAVLDRALGRSARWHRVDEKRGKTVRIDPPRLVVSQILEMLDEWPFPPLAGVIGCPTLRPDGSLLAAEGYDLATGLCLRSTVRMPTISDCPTRQSAETALALILSLLDEFPFANEESKAVAVSEIMTPVLRGAMPVAPMHVTTAPQPGTGKSYLADTASMIATGERVAVVAIAPNPEETEKRLIGCALSGFPVIGLDNCRETLEGDFLCQLTERPLLQLRALGKSDKIRIANTFTVLANGNNIAVADDLVRRTIYCALDANVENPETRTFCADPLGMARRDRGAYIAACLTISRAYIAARKPERPPPLASYEAWSDIVRGPLVWLGLADPVSTMAVARSADPVRQDRARAFKAWRDELGTSDDYIVSQLIELVGARRSFDDSLVRPELRSILLEAAQKRGGPPGIIEPRRLGKWLSRQENTIASGLKMVVDRSDSSRVRYGLRYAG